jgi:predicted homoserine dehydrogenase-like protein
MKRRDFLWSGSSAALVLTRLGRHGAAFADTRLRVGLIGCGWYGKGALFRLLQVAPAEVVSLCDVDRAMLGDAAQMVAARQVSKAPLPMIEAVKAGADVYVEKPISVDVVEACRAPAASGPCRACGCTGRPPCRCRRP